MCEEALLLFKSRRALVLARTNGKQDASMFGCVKRDHVRRHLTVFVTSCSYGAPTTTTIILPRGAAAVIKQAPRTAAGCFDDEIVDGTLTKLANT